MKSLLEWTGRSWALANRAVTVVALLTSAPALAVVRNWNNAAGGSAATSSNWTPNGVPTAGDNLNFPLAATYSVSFPSASVPVVLSHAYTSGVVSIASTGTHTVSGSVNVGTSTTAELNVTGGTIEARSLFLGTQASSSGRFRVTTPGGFPPPVPPTFRTTDAAQPCQCAQVGTGLIEVLGGATLTAAGYLELAGSAGGNCTLNVSGRSATFFQGSSLTVSGPALIGTRGTAVASVDNGAFIRVFGFTQVGNAAFGNGTVRVGTATIGFTPAFFAEQDLFIADSGFPGTGGAALVHLAKGLIRVGGVTRLGDPDGSTGLPQLRIEGGTFLAGGGFVRQTGTTFVHTGGVLHVAGGNIEYPLLWSIDGSSVQPELWIRNAATTSLANSVWIGDTGQGLLRVARPGTRFETVLDLIAGRSASSFGEVVADSSAVIGAAGLVAIGEFGAGMLTVRGGARVEGGVTRVGSLGAASITGPGSILRGEDIVVIRAAPTPAGNPIHAALQGIESRVTVDSSGVLEATQPGSIISVEGHLVVRNDATARATAIAISGLAELSDGRCDAGETQVASGGTLRGHGRLTGTLRSFARVDPAPSGAGFGTVYVDSFAVLHAGSELAVALGRPGAPGNDSLRVDQNLFLAGTLALQAEPSFVRVLGDTFVVATAANIFSNFDAVTWNGLPADDLFDVIVQPKRVLVVVTPSVVDADAFERTPAALRIRALSGAAGMAFVLELPSFADVRVTLHDVAGRQVAALQDGNLPAGVHRLQAPRRLARGIYLARAAGRVGGRMQLHSTKAIQLR